VLRGELKDSNSIALKIEGDAIPPVHALLPDASDASAADSWLIDARVGIHADMEQRWDRTGIASSRLICIGRSRLESESRRSLPLRGEALSR